MERKKDIWEREKEMEEKKIDNNIILVFINRIKHNLIINVHIQFKIQNIYNKKNQKCTYSIQNIYKNNLYFKDI